MDAHVDMNLNVNMDTHTHTYMYMYMNMHMNMNMIMNMKVDENTYGHWSIMLLAKRSGGSNLLSNLSSIAALLCLHNQT